MELLSKTPFLDSWISTISSERSLATIAEFNVKVQVKVTSDPSITASGIFASMREDGVGTVSNV